MTQKESENFQGNVIGIGSDFPGAGLSSITSRMAEFLGVNPERDIISLSRFARAIVAEATSRNLIRETSPEAWDNFANELSNLYYQDAIITSWNDKDVPEKNLKAFNDTLGKIADEHPNTSTSLKSLPEIIAVRVLGELIESDDTPDNIIITGKLATLLEYIVPDFPELANGYMKILLQIDPEIGANRVLQREIALGERKNPKTEKSRLNIIKKLANITKERIIFDWKEYAKVYKILTQDLPVEMSNLYETADIKIKTSRLSEQDVFAQLAYYIAHRPPAA